ncbi:apoptosis-associated speck-like protein containing a CARD [Pyxicephalus adspersus]|uniref:apoptosis-associated speck-like protein containing a CARD n=1 Tax=Pyxicephalus adspersus TaxID=30357 RepID=UPI003B5AB320
MEMTMRDVLLIALEDLGKKSFRKFCNKLMDCKIEKGFSKIPRCKLENAEPDDVVDLIQSYYMDSYGPMLTVDVLNAINEKKVALDLEKNLEKGKAGHRLEIAVYMWDYELSNQKLFTMCVRELVWVLWATHIPQGSITSSSAPIPHVSFVDKHREELIQRCTMVDSILDGLVSENMLLAEEIDTILAEKTCQQQMRKLFVFIRGWSESNKQVLYDVLKKKNPHLIEDLEQP